jgi:Na+-driven multidrug efflux pump
MILGAVGFMIGAGGSALIGKNLGRGRAEKANNIFSLFVYITIIIGALLAVLTMLSLRWILEALGAEGQMLEDCVTYGRIILCALPAQMLQFEFQNFFVTAEKPKLGLIFTLAAGCTNMVLDALLVAVFSWGIVGAALATALSQLVGGILPVLYFLRPNNTSLLRLGKLRFDKRAIFKACSNGSSEILSNVSMSVVSMLYNLQLMKYAGDPGIAAYGVLMYVNFTFLSCLIGYSVGIAPVISYDYGAKAVEELKNVFKKSLIIIGISSCVMLGAALALAVPISKMFVGYNESLCNMTIRGFLIFSFGFLFAGVSIFASSFFTALNNGKVSALISFLRTLVFQVAAVLILPKVFQVLGGNPLDGIWLSIVVAEVVAAVVSIIALLLNRKKYGY